MAVATTYETHEPSWWIERLENVTANASGWTARCPSHNDPKASLSITASADGSALINCFAGCKYTDILSAVESKLTVTIQSASTAKAWWAEYTGIPVDFWEKLGVGFDQTHVIFRWSESPVVKVRTSGKKELAWLPALSASPPLWPSIPPTLPATIYLTEGETDCGVLRYVGLPAWAMTKGSATPGFEKVLPILKARGVRKVVTTFDRDVAGISGVDALVKAGSASGVEISIAHLERIVDPLLGEKDLRDVWIRTRSPVLIKDAVEHVEVELTKPDRVSLTTFLESSVTKAHWLVDHVLLQQTVGMIVGSPKMGKSWLGLDLGVSVATGTPFLGHFQTDMTGPVVVITKEDPDYLLQDRLEKIMLSKGLGGHVDGMNITLPSIEPPLFLDLSRTFVFDDAEATSLLAWLHEIKLEYGQVSLVVFDPTLRMLSDVDEYKASEIGQSVFRIAQRIQTEIKASCVLIHHRAKGATEGKSSYGSIAFHAFADSTIYLKGDAPDANGWVNVETEFKSAPGAEWSYRFPELEKRYEVEVSDETVARVTITTGEGAAKRIVELLEHFPDGLSVQAINEAIENTSDFVIRSSLKVLEAKNIVERVKSPVLDRGGKRPDLWRLCEQ